MANAIVVIDVQNYFINEYTSSLPSKIREFLQRESFDHILFTKFINEGNLNYEKELNWTGCKTENEIEIHSDIKPLIKKGKVFNKNGYSVFSSQEFSNFITANKINKLFLCGIDTDACVLATAFDAFDKGLTVKVLTELCASHSGNAYHIAGKQIIEKSIQKT